MENTIKLLTEDILCKEELINEAKKIGIDKLPFGYQSLNSFIDGKTMDVHYNGHYKTYVKKLNNALSKENYGDVELEEIIKSISKYDDTIRNNAGGAFNHALFWKMLSPKKQEIPQNLKTKINKEFGSYLEFKKEFEDTAKKIFGSGWAWLVLTKQGKLKVMSTPNQDNPLMNVIKGGGFPLLGLDTWEHAYYLKYKNKRDEYIKNFWDVINWEFVNDLYLKRQKSKLTESVRIIKESNDNYIQPNGSINPKIVQEFLTNIYPECSPKIITDYDPTKRVTNACWGKIESNDCKTTYGVIGGKYAISTRGGVGEWSVINWFDGNQKVGKKIKEIFLSDNPDNDEFNAWMDKNNTKLFTEDGEYIDTLINEISNVETKQGTLDRGIELENITEKILNKKNVAVTRFCDGDVRDKFEGKDFSIIDNGVEKFIQVKRLDHLQFIKTPNNYTNYIFISKNLYRRENIHIFAFVQNEKNYLFFENKGIYKKTNDGFYKYTFFSREKIFTNDTNESSIFKKNILKEETPKKKPSKKPRQTKFNVADKTIRELIHSVYPKCSEVDSNINGCVGTIERDRCVTGKGVIGGKFMESNYGGDSEWSLVNRWDANSNIHRKILQLYNDDSLSDEFGLEAWITMNKLELFSNDGKYTPILAELGSVMVTKGVKNETYAKDIIKRIYRLEPDQEGISWQLYNNCSGSINDTKYGQDIVLEINNTTYYFQVKQTTENDIKIVTDDRGNFYRVNSYFPHQKYKMEKVDIIVYVDPTNDKYIFFKNDYDYIQTVGSGEYTYKYHINYYEEPIITNMNLEKILLTPSGKEEKELLKKTKEEKIKYYKERLDYFRQKLKDLGFSDDLRESVKNYTIKLMKLLKE